MNKNTTHHRHIPAMLFACNEVYAHRHVPVAMDALAADPASPLNDGRDATLFLLFDAIVPNIATLLDALYLRLANRVHPMGANADSETSRPCPACSTAPAPFRTTCWRC